MKIMILSKLSTLIFREILSSVLIFSATLILSITGCFAQNPFVTSIYTADPSAHVWADGRLYIYPSRDIDPPKGCDLMDRYHAYSTVDMVNWRDEGEILNSSQVSWGRKEGGFMWAPDCAYKNGTYYFYFPHPSGTEWNRTWKIGVATSDKPTSDFKSVGYFKRLSENAMIDPAVFTDADGQAYMYYGGGGVCQGGKLKVNMVEMDGDMKNMEGLSDFHEATWVFKRNGIYYLTYADNNPKVNQLRYATSSNPLGPWKYGGVYLKPTGCGTSHGSVVEYKGKWFAFYHNQSVSGRGNLRSVCVDLLNFNTDGTIQEVVQTTTGVPSVGLAPSPNPKMIKYEAENAVVENGATIEKDGAASGGMSVMNLNNAKSSLQFNKVNGGRKGGRATIAIYHAGVALAKIRLTVNDVDYSFMNTLSTGSWSNYKGYTYETVPLKAGKTNTIKLSGDAGSVSIDYITVSPF